VVVDIGKRVRDAREARELTQEELARRAGVPLNRVGRIETGAVTDPHYSTLSRIADGLGVSVGELLEEEPVLSGPKAKAPEAGQVPVAAKVLSDALTSYTASRIQAYEGDLQDPNSPHFKTATTAALWSEMLHRESKMLAELVIVESRNVFGALDTPAEKAWAALTLARTAGKTLVAFKETRQLADQRIAAMRDLPDELAQKRLEKSRHEAEESAHRLEELRRVAP